MLTVRRFDKVKVLWGKDRGKEGEIKEIDPKAKRVVVGKVNLAKRHSKPRGQGDTGGIKDIELSLPTAKVMLICPECKKTTRPKFDELTDGSPIRVCRKCGSTVPEPKKK